MIKDLKEIHKILKNVNYGKANSTDGGVLRNVFCLQQRNLCGL